MPELKNVQWLTVKEAAELWAPELRMPASIIEREIRIALYKLSISYPFLENINFLPKEEELPSNEELINQEFMREFSGKESWKLPDFWFKDLPKGPSFPGRPSIMSAIVQELRNLAEAGKLDATLAAQSRSLAAWARDTQPGAQIPTAKSIGNGIRSAFNLLKKNPP